MPIVCQVLSSYRCCLSMYQCLSTCALMSTLNPPSFVLRYRLNRFKEALEILGSRTARPKQAVALGVQCSSWWLSTPVKKFPRILDKSRCREFECFHISYKLNMFWAFCVPFRQEKTSRKSKDPEEVARRTRLEAQAGKLFLQNVLLWKKKVA